MGVKYAEVIGDPVAHSKSPRIHNFWLRELGIHAEYRATRIGPAELADYVAARRADPDWRGCNVTMPLKTAMVPFIDDLNEEAARLGAVNCVTPSKRGAGLFGTNFDAKAIVEILAGEFNGQHAVILGAGGAARAALWACLLLAPWVTVMSRNPDKTRLMVASMGVTAQVARLQGHPACDLLINATPLGTIGHPPLEIGLSNMSPEGMVFDMVYNPAETALLADARRRGLRRVDGATMLVGQAAMSFLAMFGRMPTDELARRAYEFVGG